MTQMAPRGDAPGGTRPPTLILKGAQGRRQFIEDYPLEKGEFLVEVNDRYMKERAFLVSPVCPEAVVVARFLPMVRGAMFADGSETRLKTIYKVKVLRGLERCVDLESGEEKEQRMLSLFVVKRGGRP